jgi:hypothetical protein
MRQLLRTLATILPAFFLTVSALAQNDECATATVVTVGTLPFDTTTATMSAPAWPCAAGGGPDLWYRYAATTNNQVEVTVCGSSYDTAIEVFTGTCASLSSLVCLDDACGLQTVITFNGVAGTTYLFRIGGFGGDLGSGSMTLSLLPSFGPEDECGGALPLTNGATPYTNVGATTSAPGWPCALGGSDIWYTFTAAGALVDIDTFGSGYDTALEAFSGTCASLVSIDCNDDSGGGLQSFLSLSTVPGQTYFLRVGGYLGGQGMGTLNVVGAGSPPGGTIGTNYCTANPNSTGMTGLITGTGSAVVANDNLTLEASRLPLSSFGYFLTSLTQAVTPNPGGSQGNLCLGGQIGRYTGPGQIKNTGVTGTYSLLLDLNQIPTPTGFVPAVVGQSRNFQSWHRDSASGAATSNFTNGLAVTFL